ncbi:MAG: Hsp70 family protein [Spirochaetales bacterium]|nr:Hsp70 family protein [Spirochaetales bacterium]
MSESTIGIKIANGEYYPVIEGKAHGRKRLVLTTVNDNQESVQIDLYKGIGTSIDNASYIGSLLIEDISPKLSGEPDIELVLGVDEEGNLNATASDRQSGDMQSLSVSLDSVAEPQAYDLPDFELNDESEGEFSDEEDFLGDIPSSDFISSTQAWDPPESGITPEEESRLTRDGKTGRKVHPILLVAFIIAGLAIIGLLIILLLRSFPGEDTPPLQAASDQVQPVEQVVEKPVVPEPVAIVAEEPEPVPEVVAEVEPTPVAETVVEPVVAETPEAVASGFWYDIKYGDTLWDLSNSFYRTPWLYGRIAAENKIKDPDLIFWGTQIYIPE